MSRRAGAGQTPAADPPPRGIVRPATTTVALVLAAVAAAGTVAAFPLAAQVAPTLSGQIRPRYEIRDPSSSGGPDEFTSMRTRLGVAAALDSDVSVFVQIQDVRLWGEEVSTLGDFRADALDVHQAWLRVRPSAAPWLTATGGRQEASFGGQRLIGAVDWTQQGRAFDGVRVDLTSDRATVAAIAFPLADATAPAHGVDAELYGAYATVRAVGPGTLDLYALHDRVGAAAPDGRTTFGSRWAFTDGALSGRVEGSIQRGERGGEEVSAWMAGARLGTTLAGGRAGLTLWYDHLSGDDPDDPADNAFNTLFATNHKFYGYADLFLDVPLHTGGRGLRDAAVKTSLSLGDAASLALDLHRFWASRTHDLEAAHFGDELDLTLRHRYTDRLILTGGFSYVWHTDALAAVGRLAENMKFGYVMVDAAF